METNAQDSQDEGELHGVYTIAQIPVFNLSVLEQAKMQYRLTLSPVDALGNAYMLLNIVSAQEEIILKQFKECESERSGDLTIKEYREEIEKILINPRTAAKIVGYVFLHKVSHNCNIIFDRYMVRLNDSLPMKRSNPEGKGINRLFSITPEANVKEILERGRRRADKVSKAK